MKTTKILVGMIAVFLAAGTLMAADPVISEVTVRQRWPWSRLVDIDYLLTCDATQSVDIAIAACDGSTTLTLPSASLSGDLYSVSHGVHRIIWDPTVTAYTNGQVLTQFNVTLTPTTVPLYMIVDLTKEAGAEGQLEYIYPGDARLETYGRFTNVWFGVTNDSIYATDKLVLRRIRAGTFGMGDTASISTTLTKDFYAGVFEVTEAQWYKVMSGTSTSTKPKATVSYDTIRGTPDDAEPIDWPSTGVAVGTDSFLGLLRNMTQLDDFDLPTEAQWECLCRAGTATYYNDGDQNAPDDGLSSDPAVSNAFINALGWYQYNCFAVAQPVGRKSPNNWGIFDAHGNVWEWCLDWKGTLTSGTDPVGNESGSVRVTRGGSKGDPASTCRSANRNGIGPSLSGSGFGFRLVRALP